MGHFQCTAFAPFFFFPFKFYLIPEVNPDTKQVDVNNNRQLDFPCNINPDTITEGYGTSKTYTSGVVCSKLNKTELYLTV